MSDIAIRVENLSKLYTIGRAQQRHDTTSTWLSAGLRDAMSNVGSRMSNLFRRRHSTFQIRDSTFQIRDSTFQIRDSTFQIRDSTFQIRHLLKILSRITEPTSGRAEIHGRVGSLLESLS